MNKSDLTNNGWSKYELHVVLELERHSSWLATLDEKIDKFREEFIREITTLKVKSGVWGAIGASIPVIGGILFIILKG